MIAKLKILRIAQENEEYALIIRDMNHEEDDPYIFRTGDQIHIDDKGKIITIRRNDTIPTQKVESLEFLENRLKELTWKIGNALKNDSFASQADVYERNFLMEIYNRAKKYAETTKNNDD